MNSIMCAKELYRDFKTGFEVVHAIKNVNLEIKPKRLTILRGRSGSGKTTLINLLGAIDTPDKGEIYFEGMEITGLSQRKKDELRRKKIGFVFQSGALITNMTAYENVEFGLRVAGVSYKERGDRIDKCLELVGLSKRKTHFPYELSGGECQRVAIARAIAHRPKVIFADEPTAALDTNMGLQVVKAFKDLIEKEDITIVMTTHDPSMIEIADSVYTLQDGEIVNG